MDDIEDVPLNLSLKALELSYGVVLEEALKRLKSRKPMIAFDFLLASLNDILVFFLVTVSRRNIWDIQKNG